MRKRVWIVGGILVLQSLAWGASLHGQARKSGHLPSREQKSASTEDDGQRVFEANCSRCHNAPEGFSPRISGTIVRHMRVRANLSQEEEKKLLKFFNP